MTKADIPSSTLTKGSQGPDVERLHRYLSTFGYFPNERLKQRYPSWKPLIAHAPANIGVFDDTTQAALSQFQKVHGLPESGELDQATLTLMKMPRCGYPDTMPAAEASLIGQPSNFVPTGSQWTKRGLTYRYENFSADLPQSSARAAINGAFARWAAAAPLVFTESADSPDIRISWQPGSPGGVLAVAYDPSPSNGQLAGDVFFDDGETWTVDLPTAGIDLATVALHELGHSLGLAHSNIVSSVMYAAYSGPRRELTSDDINGIRAIYPSSGFILQTSTILQETDATFAFALASNRDLFAIKKSNTASNSTEIYVLSAASNYKSFVLQTSTALNPTDATFDFVLASNRDLFAIKKSNTASNSTEIYVLSAASNYKSFVLQTGTVLHPTDATFDFVLASNRDLFAIKKSKTESNSTEIHVLSAASNYKSFALQTATALHPTDATFEFLLSPINRDLIAVKKSNTGTKSTEIHVLPAASGYKKFGKQTGTVLHETDATWNFEITTALELFGIKKSNTASHSTEVHVVAF